MKKISLFFVCALVILMFANPVFSEDGKAKITFMAGTVSYKLAGSEDWKDASVGLELSEKDTLKTGKFSNVELSFPEENKVKISQNTILTVEEIKSDGKSSFEVESGKVFMQIKKGDDTKVKTPNAVAGVRGTQFFIVVNEDGTEVLVIEGSVWLKRLGFDEEKLLNQGQILGVNNMGFSQIRMATDSEIKSFFFGIPVMMGTMSSQNMLKNDLKLEIFGEQNDLSGDRSEITQLRTDDFVTGRTLKDVHGNPVRVEQVFRRECERTIQIINITKRDDGLTYLDYKTTYNMKLPENMNDWVSFFDNDNVKVDVKDADMGTIYNGEGDNLRWIATYNPATGEYSEDFFLNGVLCDGSYEDFQDTMESDPDKLYSWGSLELYEPGHYGDPAFLYDTVIIRTYVINNDGQIISTHDFATSGDFFTFLSTSAGEVILSSDNFNYGDIDMVIIGDIGLVIVMYNVKLN